MPNCMLTRYGKEGLHDFGKYQSSQIQLACLAGGRGRILISIRRLMAHRVGTTSDPVTRKARWKRRHPTLRQWEILDCFDDKEDAQNFEIEVARRHGCNYGTGGLRDGEPCYYVYHFYH